METGWAPPGEGTDPIIFTENVPEGFRDCISRTILPTVVDHICTHDPSGIRAIPIQRGTIQPDARGEPHRRFMKARDTFHMGKGLIVPVGRPTNMPACTWLAGERPDLDDDAQQASHLIALFAASKASALSHPSDVSPLASRLTTREREVL